MICFVYYFYSENVKHVLTEHENNSCDFSVGNERVSRNWKLETSFLTGNSSKFDKCIYKKIVE
jgi:hypothetical protein